MGDMEDMRDQLAASNRRIMDKINERFEDEAVVTVTAIIMRLLTLLNQEYSDNPGMTPESDPDQFPYSLEHSKYLDMFYSTADKWTVMAVNHRLKLSGAWDNCVN